MIYCFRASRETISLGFSKRRSVKFQQNDDLKEKLLATQSDILAECAVQDKIWGIGLSMKDERRFHLNKWQGQNLLGFSLMQVRTVLEESN